MDITSLWDDVAAIIIGKQCARSKYAENNHHAQLVVSVF